MDKNTRPSNGSQRLLSVNEKRNQQRRKQGEHGKRGQKEKKKYYSAPGRSNESQTTGGHVPHKRSISYESPFVKWAQKVAMERASLRRNKEHRRQELRDEDGENREEGYNDLSPHNHYPSRPPWNENWNRTEVEKRHNAHARKEGQRKVVLSRTTIPVVSTHAREKAVKKNTVVNLPNTKYMDAALLSTPLPSKRIVRRRSVATQTPASALLDATQSSCKDNNYCNGREKTISHPQCDEDHVPATSSRSLKKSRGTKPFDITIVEEILALDTLYTNEGGEDDGGEWVYDGRRRQIIPHPVVPATRWEWEESGQGLPVDQNSHEVTPTVEMSTDEHIREVVMTEVACQLQALTGIVQSVKHPMQQPGGDRSLPLPPHLSEYSSALPPGLAETTLNKEEILAHAIERLNAIEAEVDGEKTSAALHTNEAAPTLPPMTVKSTTISTDEDHKNDEQRHGYAATEGREYDTCSTSDAPPDQSVPPSSVKLDNMVNIKTVDDMKQENYVMGIMSEVARPVLDVTLPQKVAQDIERFSQEFKSYHHKHKATFESTGILQNDLVDLFASEVMDTVLQGLVGQMEASLHTYAEVILRSL
eukprot:476760_1